MKTYHIFHIFSRQLAKHIKHLLLRTSYALRVYCIVRWVFSNNMHQLPLQTLRRRSKSFAFKYFLTWSFWAFYSTLTYVWMFGMYRWSRNFVFLPLCERSFIHNCLKLRNLSSEKAGETFFELFFLGCYHVVQSEI